MMGMLKRIFGVLFLIIVACGPAEESSDDTVTEAVSDAPKEIVQVSSGLMSKAGPIVARFNRSVVNSDLIGVSVKNNPFTFDPPIDGTVKWSSTDAIALIPNQPLKKRQAYSGKINLRTLFPTDSFKVAVVPISFEVLANEISQAKLELKQSSTDRSRGVLSGTYTFSEPVDMTKLQRVTVSPKLKLNWQINGTTAVVTSAPVYRGSKDVAYKLTFPKDLFELKSDYVSQVTVPQRVVFRLNNSSAVTTGTMGTVQLDFTDELDESFDYSGFVDVKDVNNLKVSAGGKSITISGDFQLGTTYTVTIRKDLPGKWGGKLSKNLSRSVTFSDIKPRIEFTRDGSFLPPSENFKINIRAANVRNASLTVERIFENNLSYFLAQNRIVSKKRESNDYYDGYLRYVGEEIYNRNVSLNRSKNKWEIFTLDLGPAFKDHPRGLYMIKFEFTKDNSLYERGSARGYYEDPSNNGYYYRNGTAVKWLMQSDFALTVNRGKTSIAVQVNGIQNAEPVSGVDVELRTENNQIVASGTTNGFGYVEIPLSQLTTANLQFVEARKGDRFAVLDFGDTQWDQTLFETGGIGGTVKGTRAFIYTDRGVYRPGDTINVSAILRNAQNTFPENQPIRLVFKDPSLSVQQRKTISDAKDGFYSTQLWTASTAKTGNWTLELSSGNQRFNQTIKVETVVPDRFKVAHIFPDQKLINPKQASIDLNAKFLFGTPAANKDFDSEYRIDPGPSYFSRYRAFFVGNESVTFKPVSEPLSKGKLDAQGNAKLNVNFDSFEAAHAPLRWTVTTQVRETGGRSTKQIDTRTIHPYETYIGIKRPRNYWLKAGSEITLPFILADTDGNLLANRSVKYRVYRNERYWWYSYQSRNDFRRRFRTDTYTVLESEGDLKSGIAPVDFKTTLSKRGEYLIELSDEKSGQKTAIFLRAFSWGDEQVGAEANTVVIEMDKSRYQIGESARLRFKTPPTGTIIYRLFKGDEIYDNKTMSVSGQTETEITLPVESWMAPNVYVAVSIVQPYAETANDRPLRMFGLTPVEVYDGNTVMAMSIDSLRRIRPGSKFTVNVNAAPNSQMTIAVVDEGLLSLTNFRTPNPWSAFFKKQRLAVQSYDTYGLIIKKDEYQLQQLVTIGGGLDAESVDKEGDVRRFKPVAMFSGPVRANADGKATATFTMPNYFGAVRVMAVGAIGNSYGSTDQEVPVKSELMLLPTLPRTVGPDDEFEVTASIFATEPGIKGATVKLDAPELFTVIGDASKTITFGPTGETDVFFRLKAKRGIGQGKITLTATSGSFKAESETNMEVRVSNPPITRSATQVMDAGATVTFPNNVQGIDGTNLAEITISKFPQLNISHRLQWLIRYPYGCIEQTTSSVFPQLYLKKLANSDARQSNEIDQNINAAIKRLRQFQLSSGGFSYWPGGTGVNVWGTNYAGHFLVEAKKLGYAVPDDMLNNWASFQNRRARENTYRSPMEQVYRLYGLALYKKANFGAMNYLRESKFNTLSNTAKWMLAGTYHITGSEDVARKLIRNTPMTVEEYSELSGTYGSTLRDQAMILSVLTVMNRTNDMMIMYKILAEAMSSDTWYSTQTNAYALLAIGGALEKLDVPDTKIQAVISVDGKPVQTIDTSDPIMTVKLSRDNVKSISIKSNANGKLYASVMNSGTPLREGVLSESKNLLLNVRYVNEDGVRINETQVSQGDRFYGIFEVVNKAKQNLDEIALTQIFPAGWEIENLRLNNESLPSWTRSYRRELGREEYMDIRDDRISWFFDLRRYGTTRLRFIVKLNAVSAGKYFLSPTLCTAMYDNRFRATLAGKPVTVVK